MRGVRRRSLKGATASGAMSNGMSNGIAKVNFLIKGMSNDILEPIYPPGLPFWRPGLPFWRPGLPFWSFGIIRHHFGIILESFLDHFSSFGIILGSFLQKHLLSGHGCRLVCLSSIYAYLLYSVPVIKPSI